MTATAVRPRDAIAIRRPDPSDFMELARLRLQHQAGVPMLEPTHWVIAREHSDPRIIAALGWIEEKPGMRMVVEVDRVDDRWGKIGTLVLVKAIIEGGHRNNIRTQAMINPTNEALKHALTQVDAKPVCEIWEAVCP